MSSHCARCGRAVTIEYQPGIASEDAAAPSASWRCPHWQCPGVNVVAGVERIVAVWKGHAARPAPR